MSLTVEFLPVAAAAGANVESQADFQGSGHQLTGFTAGEAYSAQFNKVLRQSSMVAATIANFIANTLNQNVTDNGDIAALITLFTEAIATAAENAQNRIVSVPYSATPVFDASLGTTFEIVLTGDVTSSTLINTSPGQRIIFNVRQDGLGGHSFAPPVNLPMSDIVPDASARSIQSFYVESGGSIVATSPLLKQ